MQRKFNIRFLIFLITLIFIQYLKFFNIFDLYDTFSTFNDIKWSGSNLVLQGKDIYNIYLNGNADNQILKAQFPNYAITSIYLHLPFGILSFDNAKFAWSVLTSILLCHLYLVFSKAKLNIKYHDNIIFLSFILLILSKPFSVLLSNGNFSILSFWAFCCFFLGKNKSLTLFITSIKYSFAPIIFAYAFLTKKIKEVCIIFIITLLCAIHFSIIFNYNLFELLILPLKIGSTTTASGFFDFQTILGNYPNNVLVRYVLIFITSLAFFYFLYQKTTRCPLFDLCLTSMVTLLFYKHLYYDQVFLLPILIYSFKLPKNSFLFALIIIFYFWFISYLEYLHPIRYWKSFMIFNNIIFTSLIVLIIKPNFKKKNCV